jgi:LysR family nitrogen assimilation transcriptional regulator
MDIRQLRYFAAVVDAGSVSKAATKLSISQPSLSQQIAAMESDLGVTLLLRSSSGVRPTEAGITLSRHARTILKQLDTLRGDVQRGEHTESGTVAVGLPTSISAVLAVPLFERVRERFPGIHLQIFESLSGYLIELLANGRLDMAVLFRFTETRGVTVLPMFKERLSLYGASWVGDPQASTVPLKLISDVPLVLPGRVNGLRILVERTFAREDLHLNVVSDMDSLPTMMTLARKGTVATIQSGSLAREHGQHMIARRIVAPSIERTVSLCMLNSMPQNAASRAVQETVLEVVKEIESLWDVVD